MPAPDFSPGRSDDWTRSCIGAKAPSGRRPCRPPGLAPRLAVSKSLRLLLPSERKLPRKPQGAHRKPILARSADSRSASPGLQSGEDRCFWLILALVRKHLVAAAPPPLPTQVGGSPVVRNNAYTRPERKLPPSPPRPFSLPALRFRVFWPGRSPGLRIFWSAPGFLF